MTQEEQIQAAIETFFADQNLAEKEQELYCEIAINGSAIVDMNGNIVRDLDISELKDKRIAVIGNHSAGLTQSLLTEITPQTVAQVNENYSDSMADKERESAQRRCDRILPLQRR